MKSGKWAKICRATAGIALAAGLTLLTAGCKGYKIQIVPDTPNDQTQNDGNQEDFNNQNNQNNQGNQGGSTTPTEPDYSQYSPLLQDVLKSDYYNDLISKCEAGQLDHGSLNVGYNIMNAIPFNFLESAGEDVEEIKNNNIKVTCYEYVKTENRNELYSCITITKNNSQTDEYVTKYLLKYNLTSQEYSDYQMLIVKEYYQSSFFIQELDKTREVELVHKFSISEKNYEGLIRYINNNNKKKEDPLKLGEKEISDVFLKPDTVEFEDKTSSKKDMYIDIEYITAIDKINIYGTDACSRREFGSARILFDWVTNPSCIDDFIYLNDPSYVKVIQINNSEPINVLNHFTNYNLKKTS